MKNDNKLNNGEVLLYQTEDGKTRVDVRLQDETVWLTQQQMAELFQKDKRTVSEHISNAYAEGELDINSTVRNFRTVQKEGNREVARDLAYYNLDVVISVGYRVKSQRGTQFRIWATQRLKEYLIKGFAMDDARLKEMGASHYFDELLERIRDIRSSEKVFYRKILDIYSSSIDYSANSATSREFFKIIQNKMHWAVHGHTAAEVIFSRADATKPHMGLTSWATDKPKRSDTEVAKNYLSHEELDTLNRLVSIGLDFAELRAKEKKPMYMKDFLGKLDEILKLSDKEILEHAGKVAHQQAIEKAHKEYDKFRSLSQDVPSLAEKDFTEMVNAMRELEITAKKKK